MLMATTYALVLRPPRAKDGLCPVHLRLTSERQAKYQAVPNLAVAVKDWNAKATLSKANWVRKTHPYADEYNEKLRKLLREVEAKRRILDILIESEQGHVWGARTAIALLALPFAPETRGKPLPE